VVVITAVGEHLQDQGRISQAAEHGRSEKGAIKAMSNPFPEDPQGTPVNMLRAIVKLIKERLDLSRVVQPCDDLTFGLGQ
jgi:hypothetical protein